MKKIILATVALVLASAVPTLAQSARSEYREHRQEHRIGRSIARGELTPAETRKLVRQQRRIDRTKARAARDGYVSRRERRQVERMQDRASRNIYRKSNNYRRY
ncbi:MAG: hypothetical protein EOP19_09585 [Hyphomicrobiales bacterium]|nr:MAG: hypothetical protein EOP19_09585 [Hyphomicrobiales bacterium]